MWHVVVQKGEGQSRSQETTQSTSSFDRSQAQPNMIKLGNEAKPSSQSFMKQHFCIVSHKMQRIDDRLTVYLCIAYIVHPDLPSHIRLGTRQICALRLAIYQCLLARLSVCLSRK